MYPDANPQTVIDSLSRNIGVQAATIAQLESMIMSTRQALDDANARVAELEDQIAKSDDS